MGFHMWSSCSSYPSSPSLPSSVSFATWASDSECCYPANWWGNNHVHHEHTLHLRNTWCWKVMSIDPTSNLGVFPCPIQCPFRIFNVQQPKLRVQYHGYLGVSIRCGNTAVYINPPMFQNCNHQKWRSQATKITQRRLVNSLQTMSSLDVDSSNALQLTIGVTMV